MTFHASRENVGHRGAHLGQPRERNVLVVVGGSSRGFWLVTGLLALACLAPRPVLAQEWYEFYADGVKALRTGQGHRAAERLRRAIEKRPEPGVGVPTYGTNFEPRYFPYLRLAEAYLLIGADEDARKALDASARLGVEPREERVALEARVRAAVEARRSPPVSIPSPAATPTPGPAGVATLPAPVAAPAPEVAVPTPVPTPAPPEALSRPEPVPGSGRQGSRPRPPCPRRSGIRCRPPSTASCCAS